MTDLIAAQEAIDDFAARFGSEARAYLDLARHAALPLALSPDLLYLIWFDFRTDEQGQPLQIPWVAVADLLLSHLCREISSETFALEEGVRQLLLQQLVEDDRFGMARVRRLAAFLDQYAEQQLHSDNPYVKEAGQAQRLTAYAYANPQQLVRYLSQLYEKPLPQSQMIRYATLMETLQAPVTEWDQADADTQQTFAQAQAVGRSLADWARGDVATAVAQLRDQFGRGVTIGDAPVALPDDVQQALRGEVAGDGITTAADLLAFFDDFLSRIMLDVSPRQEAALRAIGSWQQEPNREPLMLISGRPGSGKTELIVTYLQQRRQGSTAYGFSPQTVTAYHFCLDDRPETLDGRLFVRSVQQQLAAALPAFRDRLPDAAADDPEMPWEAWVEEQLVWPLRSVSGPTLKGMEQMATTAAPRDVLLIVDGVDAAAASGETAPVLDVCVQLLDEAPNVRLLLTSVMTTAVRDALASRTYASFTLDTVYHNFDIRIQEAPTKQPAREVEVLASPAGVSSSPFVITHDDDLVRRINREMSNVTLETPRQPIGADLFRTFIADETWQLLRASMEQVRQAGERLRLRLFLPDEAYVSLPWEWLYEEGVGFWVQQPDVSLVRYRQQTAVFRTRANPQPLKLLFATAMPKSVPPFDFLTESEFRQNMASLENRIQHSYLQNVSWRRLRNVVSFSSIHVLHLMVMMEGEYGDVSLILEEDGRPVTVSPKQFSELVQEQALALVILSAVREDQWTAVMHVSDELVAAGIPAVVALPALLPPPLMAQGVAALLEQLADGEALDTAVAAARAAMTMRREGEAAGVDLVLFTSAPHGNIWRSEITAVDLYEALADDFTLTDLQRLCLELQLEFDQLTGEGRRGKMVSLVRMMQQQDRLQELALTMLDARPNTNFAYRRQETVDETAVPAELLNPQTLQRVMNEQFNLEEIRVLCFDLGVEYETLRGETRIQKVRSLIDYHRRRQALSQLVESVLRQRPSLREQFQSDSEALTADPVEIYRILVAQFSLDELRELMFDLAVNEEDLGGSSEQAKAREFVLWMQRRGRLPELVQAIQQRRDVAIPVQEKEEIPVDVSDEAVTLGGYETPKRGESTPAPSESVTKGIEQDAAPSLQAVHRALVDYFSGDELRTVSFEMGVDYENLAGDSRTVKARSLVEAARRENRLTDLAQLIQRVQPDANLGGPQEAA